MQINTPDQYFTISLFLRGLGATEEVIEELKKNFTETELLESQLFLSTVELVCENFSIQEAAQLALTILGKR